MRATSLLLLRASGSYVANSIHFINTQVGCSRQANDLDPEPLADFDEDCGGDASAKTAGPAHRTVQRFEQSGVLE